jgi:hypothetical protein
MQWSKEWRGRNEQDTWTAGFVESVEAETEMGIEVLKRMNGRGVGRMSMGDGGVEAHRAGDEQQRRLDWWHARREPMSMPCIFSPIYLEKIPSQYLTEYLLLWPPRGIFFWAYNCIQNGLFLKSL